jgi:DNA polymerase-3 subunit alpha
MEMLIRDGYLEWQGTLRDTYNKYLHPDVLNYDNQEMWKKVGDNAILDLFQFDTNVGLQCAKKIQPTNVVELAVANSLMRLMPESDIQPVDKYVQHKNNPEDWQKEMESYGLTEEEIKTVRKHLDEVYGVSESQELMMLLSMDEKIANFSIQESNKLRKGVSKKLEQVIAKAKEDFFKKGKGNGTSENLLNYIWSTQIQPQCGYSFSRLHSIGYSLIGLQEMNIAHFYPPLYWDTACLTIKAGADEDNEDNKSTNYGKMASAIGVMQERGVTIALPDINTAKLSFSPDVANNQIIYGLKGIVNLSDNTIQTIINHRPYTSLKDFHERMVLTKQQVTLSTGKTQMRSLVSESQMITLIKAGAFDKLENKPRGQLLEEYLRLINPPKEKLNATNIDNIVDLGIVPDELSTYIRYHRFKNYLSNNKKIQDESSKSIKWHCLSNGDEDFYEYAVNFFNEHFANLMKEDTDYHFDDEGLVWIALGTSRKGSFLDIYKQKMKEFNTWLESDDCLNRYNQLLFNDVKNTHMQGDISKWEMDSICFYYSMHPLAKIDRDKYGVSNFFELPEEPQIVGYNKGKGGTSFPKYHISRIFGTVLDKDKNKSIINLLTPEGVVTVKFHDGQFSFYDKTISTVDKESGKKVTLEKSWFERGSLLTISGYRKGDQFRPKRYKNSVIQHTVQKIMDVQEDGSLILQSERYREEETQ